MTRPANRRPEGRRRLLSLLVPPPPLAGLLLAALLLAALLALSPGARAEPGPYVRRNLVSDGSLPAARTDPRLISPWGIARSGTGGVWLAGNGMAASIAYDGDGAPLGSMPAEIDVPGGTPTGIAASDGPAFLVPGADGAPVAATLLFATEAGIISAWSPRAEPGKAMAVIDNAAAGANYKGLAISAAGGTALLYATDFHGGKVDVFDAGFRPVRLPAGAFRDPALPPGFAPFGIQAIDGSLYVSYARQDELKEDAVPGPGQGFVNVFDRSGRLLRRLASRGSLNAPWGLALAPADFGPLAGLLLVGNSGDGRIGAYHPGTGEFRGFLRESDGRPIAIEGLWGLCFAGAGLSGASLYFAAGPAYENQGLYGRIEPADRSVAAGYGISGPGAALAAARLQR